ncbi:MAG: hypothetical protein AABW54_04060 [Candidatus Micrarchaeota archaeon]
MPQPQTNLTTLKNDAKNLFAQSNAAPAPEKKMQSLFLPVGTTGEKMVDGKPLRAAQVWTRRDYIADYYGAPNVKEGNAGSTYLAMFYTLVCLALTIISYVAVNPYVAAVFAFLTGKYWSDRIINYAWAVTWRKGRPLIQTV